MGGICRNSVPINIYASSMLPSMLYRYRCSINIYAQLMYHSIMNSHGLNNNVVRLSISAWTLSILISVPCAGDMGKMLLRIRCLVMQGICDMVSFCFEPSPEMAHDFAPALDLALAPVLILLLLLS